jgi:hypothetical protein
MYTAAGGHHLAQWHLHVVHFSLSGVGIASECTNTVLI